ncbi:MAG: polysaccharide biosynthesis protein CapD [Gemmatimonadetes bacterium]|nr:polysaccharide biosynthesis protein CapD [Gemmatimonadota bacterium]
MDALSGKIASLRNRMFFLSDVILISVSALAAFAARYGMTWTPELNHSFRLFLLATLPIKLALLVALGVYRRLWRYASVSDLELLVMAAGACAIVDGVVGIAVVPFGATPTDRLSYAVILLDALLCAGAIAAPRLAARVLARRDRFPQNGRSRRAIVVGAGVAGGMIVRELLDNAQLGILPVAVLDDDPHKRGMRLQNVPILGALSDLSQVARDVGATDVVVAMPSAPGLVLRNILKQSHHTGLATLTVPGLFEILSGEKRVHALRQIEIQDLLRRESITTDLQEVSSLVTGKVVMVTGAGGSIGSELCRQLARLKPEKIVALGRGENSIFELLQEMSSTFPGVRVDPIIGDVRDHSRMNRVFAEHRPYSVFHAAAHKHVPLMEANVAEAVLNNVLGTRNVVTLCREFDVEHFVLISTDKAVRPTSVMGATKRIAEHIVHRCSMDGGSGYVSVRFGNVLGSRGSVVPTFMRQIAQGGPVTITHPDMTRYFMTIPEAVQLVLQASAIGTDGEVFVLDMGEPVRIHDLANDLIRLSGLEPEVDVEVHFTGIRDGEKLYEELFFAGADISPTVHPKILRACDAESSDHRECDIEALIQAAREHAPAARIRELLLAVVPEYAGCVRVNGQTVTVADAFVRIPSSLDSLDDMPYDRMETDNRPPGRPSGLVADLTAAP